MRADMIGMPITQCHWLGEEKKKKKFYFAKQLKITKQSILYWKT